jgi:UTP-glucose-1-phosphate uridylyltransferase
MDPVLQVKSVVRKFKEEKPRSDLTIYGRLWLKNDCFATDDDDQEEEEGD